MVPCVFVDPLTLLVGVQVVMMDTSMEVQSQNLANREYLVVVS